MRCVLLRGVGVEARERGQVQLTTRPPVYWYGWRPGDPSRTFPTITFRESSFLTSKFPRSFWNWNFGCFCGRKPCTCYAACVEGVSKACGCVHTWTGPKEEWSRSEGNTVGYFEELGQSACSNQRSYQILAND
ncbi:hypothetical protein CISG_08644 [Coccidioides immitis RMSCC 3703]|uniref:Uncharacterized protein n=1 Tax=Coccidioides immitis RMSCC 3703 TaxID=454286 RepID=A0A0J8R8A2_COCIT|nr:hypothetical protein CISG_08644 [Coccidioides immitis RMSCC 3703]